MAIAKKKAPKKQIVKLPKWVDVEDDVMVKFRIEFSCRQSDLEDILDHIRQTGETLKVERQIA